MLVGIECSDSNKFELIYRRMDEKLMKYKILD